MLVLLKKNNNNKNLLIKLNVKIKKLKNLKFWNDTQDISTTDHLSIFESLCFIPLYLIMAWNVSLVQQSHESRSVWNSMRFLLISYASQLYSRSNWWSFIGINQRIWEYFVEYSWNLSKIALIKKKNYIHICSFEFMLCTNIIIYFRFIMLCDKNRRKERGNLFLVILITFFLSFLSFLLSRI